MNIPSLHQLDASYSGTHRFVFIAGAHKSGTSIFHRSIRDHPEVSGFSGTGVPEDEGQLLQSVFPPARETGGMGRFGFRAESVLTEKHPLCTQENAEALLSEWGVHWNLNKTVLVEKSPPTIVRARFFQALFPSSRFILLLRHPISVSYATGRWTEQPLHELIAHWLALHEHFEREQRPYLERLLICRYEDFVSDPEAELKRIFSFLDVPPLPPQREIRSGIDRKYFRRWQRMGWTPRGRRYRDLILDRYQSRLEAVGYGYDLERAPSASSRTEVHDKQFSASAAPTNLT